MRQLESPEAERRRGAGSALAIVLIALVVAAHAGIWWRAVHWWPLLPDKIPTHFGMNGAPNAWSSKSIAAWFLLPAIATFLLVFLGVLAWGIGRLMRSVPQLCNMPHKDLFLKLSPAGRAAVAAPTQTYLLWTLLLTQGLFLWIIEGAARVAVGKWTTLPSWGLFIFLPGVLGMLVPYIISTGRTIKREAQREGLLEEAESGASAESRPA